MGAPACPSCPPVRPTQPKPNPNPTGRRPRPVRTLGLKPINPTNSTNPLNPTATPPTHAAGRDLYSALGLKSAAGGGRLFGWERRGRRLLWELAKALNYLHSRNIVHLDM